MRSHLIGRSVLLAALAASAGVASAQTNVSPGNMNGWQTYLFDDGSNPVSATATFVNGAGSPPLGSGSLQLTTGQYGNGASRIATDNFLGTPLASIGSLTYSTFTQTASYSGLHIYLSIRIDYTGDGFEDDQLFFEPEYQRAGYNNPNIPVQADATTGLWQNWDALHGGWWSNNNDLNTGAAGANVLPLSAFIAAHPNAVITNEFGPGVRLTAGFGAPTWDDFTGYVDNFSMTIIGGPSVTYDFEPTPTPGAAALLGLGGLAACRRRR